MNKLSYMSFKGKGHPLTLPKGHLVFKLKSCFFQKTVELYEIKYHVKGYRSTRMKIYANGMSYLTKLVATPIMVKFFKNTFF